MRNHGKKRRQHLLSLLLCITMLGQFGIFSAWANDRAADIIGSRPLLEKNLITPAGLSGKGQIVGIADSGLDDGSMSDIHPDLQSESAGIPKVMLHSYTDRELADDPDGHGTFMAATIAGTGQASEGKYQGIAPGASLYFQALLDKEGQIKFPAQINDLFMPAYSAGVRIHVNGWGGGDNKYGDYAAEIDKFIYQHPDFLPIFGAGNNGPAASTLTTEANSKNGLVVGASQVPRPAFDPESRFADQVVASSSRGPTGDGRIKPDLLAPGSLLISACSSLTEGSFTANSLYTRMGGTSMAAAVTGGALALLCEQLSVQYNLNDPSAALLKALLINGARDHEQATRQQGFGILDLAGTVLALQEDSCQFIDSKNKLDEGESHEYKFWVTDKNMPVKVTLAWVDPAGKTENDSALINNLDLYVRDQQGRGFYGNDFAYQGKKDNLNNVEQITIKVPEPGEYTIVVRASEIGSGNGQDYALAYGQVLKTGVVEKADSDKLILADGTTVNLDAVILQQVVDGVMTDSHTTALPGSEVYFKADKAYVFGQSWHTGGVQALATPEGDLLLEMNNTVREGGYYLDPQVKGQADTIMSNGLPISSISQITTGSELKATVNPVLQTLWKLETFNQKVSGIVAQVDIINNQLQLLNDSQVYTLAPWSAISYYDKLIDCTAQEGAYSTAEKNDLARLMPGTAVTMQVSPQSGMVQALFLERPLVIGKVAQINAAENKILLESGKSYEVFLGTLIYRDKNLADLDELQTGDWVKAQLLSDSSDIISLQAYSNVDYGRVTYVSPQRKSLYVLDTGNYSHTYTYNQQTDVFSMDIQVELSALAAGDWVRVITDPNGEEAWRIDKAGISEEKVKIFQKADLAQRTLQMEDGSEYIYDSATRISKGGYKVSIDDIVPGERVYITTLAGSSSLPQLLAGVEAEPSADPDGPWININAYSLNGVLILEGSTNGDRLYLYRKDGSRELIGTGEGSFSRIFNLLDNEQEVTLIALNMQTGVMQDRNVRIGAFPIETKASTFTDISGHWAEDFITTLVRKGLVKGYEDGSFRPDNNISRAELMVLIANQQKLDLEDVPVEYHFTDENIIPWWALQEVLAAWQAGLVNGYPDGSFQPYQAVTRRELALIFANWQDSELVNLFPGETLQPDRLITRAEAAAVLARF